ncbi:MAG: hypothetical protein R3E39_02505 [Anaerolineae bacterium]
MNLVSEQPILNFPVDREHVRLRLGVVVLFVALWCISFAIINAFIPSSGLNIIAGLIAFGLAALGGRLIEPRLKQFWPSGRNLKLDNSGAYFIKNGQMQIEISATSTANVHYWRFKIPRRGRMPKGWYVVACAVQQDDTYLAVYTFASPHKADQLNQVVKFTDLVSDKSKPDMARTESLRTAGEQRRLRTAEQHRWHNGGELSHEDFEQFLHTLNGQFPLWNT